MMRFARGYVSIHAPRVGGDTGDALMPLPLSSVSIHAPRVGGDGCFDRFITR